MSLDDFTHLLDLCGGDPAVWPPGAEAAARRLMSVSPQARAAFAGAQALDAAMAATRAGAVSPTLAARATARAQVPRPAAAALWTRAAGVAAAAAVTLCLGLATGVASVAPTPDQTVAAALGAPAEVGDAG